MASRSRSGYRGGSVKWETLDHLLGGPLGARVRGYVEVDNLPALVSEDEKHVQCTKRYGRDGEEVNRGEFSCMVV